MNNYRITSVKYEDLEQCVNTIREAFKDNAIKYGFTKQNYPSSGAFITLGDLIRSKDKGVHMYAAWIEDRIVGFVQLEHFDKEICKFQKFAVLPEYQHSGIGKMLIAFCRNKSKNLGAKKMTLLMVYENEVLRNFYEANGFKLIRTERDESHPFLQGIMEMKIE